jgi:hypothetical protein
MHVYEVRPHRDKRGVDLISDALPFGRLWYVEVSDCEGRQDSGDLTWRGVINQHGVQWPPLRTDGTDKNGILTAKADTATSCGQENSVAVES